MKISKSSLGIAKSETHRKRISKGRLGIKPWNYGLRKEDDERVMKHSLKMRGKKHPMEVKQKISSSKLGKPNHAIRGSNHPNWRGGITPKNLQIRLSLDYKIWHRKVLKRDDFTCTFCKKRGGKLTVDHIKPFSKYPSLRLALSNGRTLCHECHLTTDTYGGRVCRNQ